jgi:hypothetical protein
MVIEVPPELGPVAGVTVEIVGAATYVNFDVKAVVAMLVTR